MLASLLSEMLARAGNREALLIKQTLDFEDGLDIFAAAESITG